MKKQKHRMETDQSYENHIGAEVDGLSQKKSMEVKPYTSSSQPMMKLKFFMDSILTKSGN